MHIIKKCEKTTIFTIEFGVVENMVTKIILTLVLVIGLIPTSVNANDTDVSPRGLCVGIKCDNA